MYLLKQDKNVMEELKDRIWLEMGKINQELDEKTNQFNTVENFVEKYIPLRIQSQISETLGAVLQSSLLNKLENYEMEKFAQLNQIILQDDGNGNLKRMMTQLKK